MPLACGAAMDDVAIIDHVANAIALHAARWSSLWARQQPHTNEEAVQSIIVEIHAQTVTDQAGGHRVEHMTQQEAAVAGSGERLATSRAICLKSRHHHPRGDAVAAVRRRTAGDRHPRVPAARRPAPRVPSFVRCPRSIIALGRSDTARAADRDAGSAVGTGDTRTTTARNLAPTHRRSTG